jgi:MFS family permease
MSELRQLKSAATRNIYAFGITSFLNDTATEMAYWVLPAFLISLGAGPAKLGLIEGIAESVASFVQLFSGYLADRITRRKPIVVAGYAAANAVKPVLAVVTAWWHVLLIRFADRFAKGIRAAPRDVMVAESVSEGRLGSAYGLIQSLDSAGAIAGPLIALVLLARFQLRTVFWAAGIPGALCVLAAFFGIRETHHASSDFDGKHANPVRSRPELRGSSLPGTFYHVLVAVTLFSLGNSSDMFLIMRAQNVGIPVSLAPLLGLVFNVTYTLGSWPAGWLSDHFSREKIAATGYLIFAAVYAVFGRAPSTLAIWISMAVYGVYYALTQPVLKALVVDTVTGEIRGRALGIYFFTTSIATLAASLITGELWKNYGPTIPFYASAGMAVLSAFILLASVKFRTHAQNESASG